MNRRVVITGLGPVSPIGTGKDAYWSALEEGVNGIRAIQSFDASNLNVKIAGEVIDFDPTLYMPKKETKRTDRVIQFALAAADLAVKDSGLDTASLDPWKLGVVIGSGVGGFHTFCEGASVIANKGPRFVSPFFIPMMIGNMPSAYVAIRYGAKAPNMGIVTACASAVNSIGEAWHMIRRGDADAMICGGAEACVTPLTISGFGNMKALCSSHNDDPEHACRPFDAARDGFVVGEGAGVLVIEELEHAKARGAHIYAELAGYGATCDAIHMTAPDPEGVGAERAMALACRQAGWDMVDLVNAHGTSTHLNDTMESKAINRLFGENASKVLVHSTKSMIGHSLGACGGLGAIAALMAIEKGVVHPSLNYETPDPECNVTVVKETLRGQNVERALVNNFGFGGHNGVLALGKYKD